MSIEEIRKTLKPNLKKVAAKDVAYIFAEKASDGLPALLVGEPGKPLSAPFAKAIRDKATGIVTGFVSKADDGLQFRVRTGDVGSKATALQKLIRKEASDVSLSKALLVPEAKKVSSEEEETEALRGAAKMMEDAEEENRAAEAVRKRVSKFDGDFKSALEIVKKAIGILTKTEIKGFGGIKKRMNELGEARTKLADPADPAALTELEKAIPEIKGQADAAHEVAENVAALDLHMLEEERKKMFKPAIEGWKTLADLTNKYPLEIPAINECVGKLDDLGDLVTRSNSLRRRVNWIEKQISDSLHDGRNETLQEFAIKLTELIKTFRSTVGEQTIKDPDLDTIEKKIAGHIKKLSELKPTVKVETEQVASYTDAGGGKLTYDGNTYKSIHEGVYGCIKPGTCAGEVLKAYQAALDNGVISTFGTGEAGVKKKGSSWEIKVRRDRCEGLGLGTSARIDGKTESVPKIGGGNIKFVLFDTFFDAH